MNITSRKEGIICVVSVGGRLDGTGAPEVETQCRSLIDSGEIRQLLDLTDVEYISSAGLRSLLVVAKQIKAVNGILVLCNLQPVVKEVMEISGFDKILTLAADQATGLTLFDI